MKKGIILQTLVVLSLIGIASANLQIQTNIENARQTIRQIFVTNNGLEANSNNTLMSINADDQWTVFIQNTLQTNGTVMFNWLQNNNNPDNIVTIQSNGTLQKTPISQIWWAGGTAQREETTTTLSTNKIVWINNIWSNHQFWVWGNSIFQSWTNTIYIYPNNQFSSNHGWLASRNNNLKINTKSWWTLYINADVPANTAIYWDISVWEWHTPTARVDIEGSNGYDQLRLRESFVPESQEDSRGDIWSITRGEKDGTYRLFIKTPDGWYQTPLEWINERAMP